jgi:hypothetical protein
MVVRGGDGVLFCTFAPGRDNGKDTGTEEGTEGRAWNSANQREAENSGRQ